MVGRPGARRGPPWRRRSGSPSSCSAPGSRCARRSTTPGLLAVTRAGVPVVSIGNLAVGGAGKTPAAIAVGRRLLARGRRVAVLSRGYGAARTDPRVVSDGTRLLLGAEEGGDEPVLVASRLPGAAVLCGPRRAELARAAVSQHGADALLLDDGFQHRALARDLDVVVLDAANPFGNGRLLPARAEPRAALGAPPGRARLALARRPGGARAASRRCGPSPAPGPAATPSSRATRRSASWTARSPRPAPSTRSAAGGCCSSPASPGPEASATPSPPSGRRRWPRRLPGPPPLLDRRRRGRAPGRRRGALRPRRHDGEGRRPPAGGGRDRPASPGDPDRGGDRPRRRAPRRRPRPRPRRPREARGRAPRRGGLTHATPRLAPLPHPPQLARGLRRRPRDPRLGAPGPAPGRPRQPAPRLPGEDRRGAAGHREGDLREPRPDDPGLHPAPVPDEGGARVDLRLRRVGAAGARPRPGQGARGVHGPLRELRDPGVGPRAARHPGDHHLPADGGVEVQRAVARAAQVDRGRGDPGEEGGHAVGGGEGGPRGPRPRVRHRPEPAGAPRGLPDVLRGPGGDRRDPRRARDAHGGRGRVRALVSRSATGGTTSSSRGRSTRRTPATATATS